MSNDIANTTVLTTSVETTIASKVLLIDRAWNQEWVAFTTAALLAQKGLRTFVLVLDEE